MPNARKDTPPPLNTESTPGPIIAWPASQRAALVVIIDVDAPGEAKLADPGAQGLDYEATGLQRLLMVLADLDLAATTAWSAAALATYPQLARVAQDGGHELALSRRGESSLDQQVALLAKISDTPAVGLFEPFLPNTAPAASIAESPELFATVQWVVTGASGDVPFRTGNEGIDGVINIPFSPYWTDTAWLDPQRPLPPSSFLEAWSLSLAAVRTDGGLMVVVLHPHIAGRPGISSQVERFLDEAIESGDVWIANAGQVADWWRQETALQADR